MSGQQIRPGRPDDECWQYVDKIDEKRWTCKYCRRSFGGSITRAKAHLAGIQGQNICVCTGEVPDNVKRAASQGFYSPPQGGSRHVEPTRQAQPSMLPDRERDNRTCKTATLAGAKRFQVNEEVSSSCNTSTADFIERLLEQPLPSDNLAGLNTDTSGLEMNNNQTFEACNETTPTEDVEEQLQLRESPSRKKGRTEVMAKLMDHREFTHESTDIEHCTTGIAAGTNSPAFNGNHNINAPRLDDEPQFDACENGGTNPNNTNAPKSDDKHQLSAYYNSGMQHIKGINLSGHIKGNANGVVNLGTLMTSASTLKAGNGTCTPSPTQSDPDSQQKQAALERLVDTLDKIDDSKNDSTTSQPSCSPSPASGKITIGTKVENAGMQIIKGLSNQIGYVEGNANGVINLGELIV